MCLYVFIVVYKFPWVWIQWLSIITSIYLPPSTLLLLLLILSHALQTMSADKTLSSSNLFDGLVNSTTSSLNCHLAIPTLPSHPDLITLLHHTSHITTSPVSHSPHLTHSHIQCVWQTMRSPSDSPTPSSSYYHTPSVWCDVPPRDWSGWCKR